jgi:hypothetical protein
MTTTRKPRRKPRPDYEALVDRVQAGEITRLQAAQLSGAPNTFLSWVRSSGAYLRLKDVRASAGDKHWHSHAKLDPDKAAAYEEALALAQTGRLSLLAISRQFAARGVSYEYLLRLHNRRKKAQAQPVSGDQRADDETASALARSIDHQ